MATADATKTTCYRHRDRETGVSCSSCGRPICTECMTSTPVGMRCPECSRQTTKVRSLASSRQSPDLTRALIAINVAVFLGLLFTGGGGLGAIGGPLIELGALNGFAVAEGEWWRLVTGGFLHAGLLHILFNMYILYILGSLLEPGIGRLRFGLIYGVSLLGGSLGAILLSPDANTVGASGAVFGLMGAAIIGMRAQGIDPMQSGLGLTLLLNLGITFLIPGISIGGHLGGLAAGFLVGWLLLDAPRRLGSDKTPIAISLVIGVACAVGAVLLAGALA
ncbi:MAG TPA: rhomboid family intramembrane serine protease [Solirubrobacteraceae bacterium]|nr:rhomboid family intramembrane serine protease [Solirubrobacteraceae bacterium]